LKSQFISVGKTLVNREVVETAFTCDLRKCKGACCTLESDYGAPLLREELPLIDRALPAAKRYLDAPNRQAIETDGFYENVSGGLVTRSMNRRDCVFVFYNGEVAHCSLERAFFEGESDFRKPVSCHLFPIRISDFGGEVLRYERFSECQPALTAGKETGSTIAGFCREALIRYYGEDWYQELLKQTNGESA
jgi:hypothetical protein